MNKRIRKKQQDKARRWATRKFGPGIASELFPLQTHEEAILSMDRVKGFHFEPMVSGDRLVGMAICKRH